MALYTVTNKTTKQEYIDNIFSLEVGDVFKWDTSTRPETVLSFLELYKADAGVTDFVVDYVLPGHELYFLHGGPGTFVVTEKA